MTLVTHVLVLAAASAHILSVCDKLDVVGVNTVTLAANVVGL
jgi:hypothetical protein